jgi:hypothetical protein
MATKVAPPVMYSAKLSETTAMGKTIYESDPGGSGDHDYHRLSQRILKDAPPFEIPQEDSATVQEEKGRARLRPINGFKRHGLKARLEQAAAEQEGPDLTEIKALLK